MIGTIKFLAALLLYPLTYLGISMFVGSRAGWGAAVVTAILLPVLSLVALRVLEDIDSLVGDVRAVTHRVFRAYGHERLILQRHALRDEMLDVWRQAETAAKAEKRA